MIITHEQDKMFGPALLLYPDTQMWRRAHIELAIPYFFLSYDIAQGESWIGHTELYWEVEQLLHCCRQIASVDQLRLAQIALISPSWMNKEDGWQMHTVHEIRRTQGQDHYPAATIYVTDSGQRFSDRPEGDIEELADPILKIVDGEIVIMGKS